MIVSFHIAVYIVYYVWNTYISHNISDNQGTQHSSDNSQSGNRNQTDPSATNLVNHNVAPENSTNNESNVASDRPLPNQSRQNLDTSSGDVDTSDKPQKSTPMMEGEGDYHHCLSLPEIFSDDGDKKEDMIYNVELVTMEGEGDFHRCLSLPTIFYDDRDKTEDMIYNVEPVYTSNQSTSTQNDIGSSQSGDRIQTNPINKVGSNVDDDELSDKKVDSVTGLSDKSNKKNGNNSLVDVDPNFIPQKIIKAKESGSFVHPCLPELCCDDEDRGRDMIYNVEPEYNCICSETKVQFFPPVYIQRYMEIEKILKEPHWAKEIKKVVDFGCSELSFEMRYLKKFYGIEDVVAVDIDVGTLESNCCKVSPFPCDYLKKRPTPLSIRVFHGSVAHTHDSLIGADAVIAIELIEHLFPPELECLPFTIFGFIKPKIAIFTTPNSDFNVLFKGLSGFRHPDHKFEWSQQQFEDWAHNLVQQYPEYQVTFKGIGPGPPGSEKYGCCSQMAMFIKVNESYIIADEEMHIQDGNYTLIAENIFPFFKDKRTEEEKIRDAAECFILNCKMRSRVSDVVRTELSIESVMGRIRYYNKEKLKEILIGRNWEVKINTSGEEVVVFPDSEEEEDSEPEPNEYVTVDFESFDNGDVKNFPEPEENWDEVESVHMDMTLTASPHDLCHDQISPGSISGGDHACVSQESCHSINTADTKTKCLGCTNIEELVSSDKLKFSPSETCSISEIVVPDIELSDKLSSSHIDCVPEKDTNLNFERSIYETPYNNDFSRSLKYNCDLSDCSLPLSDQSDKGCKRALIMDSPEELKETDVNPQSEDLFCCLSTVSSSCDTSIYATPCCSQRHKNNIPKCLSLQQISTFGSPAFSIELETTLKEGNLVRDHNDKFSKSVEGFKSLENDLTCSSTSRIVDSGYPDSYAECNMDMDLTPEQFDDIETESEDNDVSSRSLSPPTPPPQIPWLMDDVQNGDVANNNRDGEGNNLVADMEEELLEFEARIDEINNEVLNLAPANDALDFDHDMILSDIQEICSDCKSCIPDPPSLSNSTICDQCVSEKSTNYDLLKLTSVLADKGDFSDKQSLRSTKSDTSIATQTCSFVPVEGQMNSTSEVVSYHQKIKIPTFKTHSSLTTVLDGHSKFSNCSLVRPVEVYQAAGLENNSPDQHSKLEPSGSREPIEQESASDVHIAQSLISTGLHDQQSLESVYQSAESLNNISDPQTSSFPNWLLKMFMSDIDENEVDSADSVQSVWDSDSLEERMELNYDVQVDARGGGDPQRDTWH